MTRCFKSSIVVKVLRFLFEARFFKYLNVFLPVRIFTMLMQNRVLLSSSLVLQKSLKKQTPLVAMLFCMVI